MWLLILSYAALIATILWYRNAENDEYMLKFLSTILWGASIMFFIDHIYGWINEGKEFFEISIDAAILGFTLLYIALLLWLTILLIKDPKRVFKK
ncbi:MAG: hypothetical protein B6U89_06340 [Desulfurococcales archaeon ex4484_58]|nr:MAG: hypothetical protein B6U89_06340 [Desulfurococcales archaeon ex4484_58]